jgi:hypothetical protein
MSAHQRDRLEPRRFVSPIGRPTKIRAAIVSPAERPERFITWNRYPRQVIGAVIRLPSHSLKGPHFGLSVRWARPARWWLDWHGLPLPRDVVWHENGMRHTVTLPDVEAEGVLRLGCWVKRSPFPGTRRWEWMVANMPVTAVTGMSSGYTRTRWGAKQAARRALRFWQSYGYPIDWTGAL